jgi:hypothetical protein
MINKNLVRKYYSSKDFKPYLPDHPTWYHFRVRCLDGHWKKIPLRINSSEKLRRAIISRDAGDVYFSTAAWLNPEKVGRKDGPRGPGYVMADSLMLWDDYDFDFDADPVSLENLEITRKNAVKLVDYMKTKPDFKRDYINFTAGAGFHVNYKRNEKVSISPRDRIKEAGLNRKRFKYSLPEDIIFDVNTSLNPLLVRRLPGTPNTKTGYVSTIIPEEILRLPIKKLLEKIPFITKTRPGIPLKREMTHILRTSNKMGGGDKAGLAPRPKLSMPFMTNKVIGVKDRYVMALQYQPGQKYEQDIIFLQKHFKLSTVYVLEYEKYHWCITPQTFPKARLIKMMARTSCINKSQLWKYGHTLIPIFNFKLVKRINSDQSLKNASLGHINALEIWIKEKPTARFLEGKDEIKLGVGDYS